jgi:hypothetical protein
VKSHKGMPEFKQTINITINSLARYRSFIIKVFKNELRRSSPTNKDRYKVLNIFCP